MNGTVTEGPKMENGGYTPVARLPQHLKDVRLMLDAAGELPLPLSEAHRLILETAGAARKAPRITAR